MSNVFITGSNPYAANYIRDVLKANGHNVVSTWHNKIPMKRSSEYKDAEKMGISYHSRLEIQKCDVLVNMADPDMVSGGKFVDAGIAIGMGKMVYNIGRIENLKMYDPSVVAVATIEDLLRCLAY